jgi:hypothetical protein
MLARSYPLSLEEVGWCYVLFVFAGAVFHISLLKPYYQRSNQMEPQDVFLLTDNSEDQ